MQQGYDHSGHRIHMPPHDQSQGPPWKKHKAQPPVITKYAPPPGYVPPAAQHAPLNAWSTYGYPGAIGQQAYDPQAQQYWAAYGYRHPGYDYSAYYQQGWAQPPAQTPYVANGAQSAHPSTHSSGAWPVPPQPIHQVEQAARHRHNSAPNISFSGPAGQGKASGPNDELDESHEDYCEFTRSCYYASRESEVVKELSIGLVHMKLALPANKAIPATWDQANEIAKMQDPHEKHDADCCVSDYHTEESAQVQLKSVRESQDWDDIKDDLIFRSLPLTTDDLVSRSRLQADFRNRVDTVWLENKPNLRRPPVQRKQTQTQDSEQHNNGSKKRELAESDYGPSDGHSSKRYRQSFDEQDGQHRAEEPSSRENQTSASGQHSNGQRKRVLNEPHSDPSDEYSNKRYRLDFHADDGQNRAEKPPSRDEEPVSKGQRRENLLPRRPEKSLPNIPGDWATPDDAPLENKWAQLAREHYPGTHHPGTKRGFDHGHEDFRSYQMRQDKRRK